MPELPEVQNMLLGIRESIGLRITNIITSNKNLREPIIGLDKIKNLSIMSFNRVGKYIVINLEQDYCLLIHAGMSGNIFLQKSPIINNKHNHLIITLNNSNTNVNINIVYNDPRRFGLIMLETKSSLKNNKYYKKLGLDGLSDELSSKYLLEKLKNKKYSAKAFLLDQSIIAGIGNIYASEILFLSKISPYTIASQLSLEKLDSIILHTRSILKKAIKLKGSSIKTYKNPNGEIGAFQNEFFVYNLENKPCKVCLTNKITKVLQNQRSSFFCSNCQL